MSNESELSDLYDDNLQKILTRVQVVEQTLGTAKRHLFDELRDYRDDLKSAKLEELRISNQLRECDQKILSLETKVRDLTNSIQALVAVTSAGRKHNRIIFGLIGCMVLLGIAVWRVMLVSIGQSEARVVASMNEIKGIVAGRLEDRNIQKKIEERLAENEVLQKKIVGTWQSYFSLDPEPNPDKKRRDTFVFKDNGKFEVIASSAAGIDIKPLHGTYSISNGLIYLTGGADTYGATGYSVDREVDHFAGVNNNGTPIVFARTSN